MILAIALCRITALNISIIISTILVLLLVSCKNDTNLKSDNSSHRSKKNDTVLVNDIPTIISIDKKWNLKMFSINKSELRFGSGGSLSDFKSREFYGLEISQAKNDTLKMGFLPLHKQTSPSAHERHLTVFIYDSLTVKYSYITEGYNYEKKDLEFFLSTDLLNDFDKKINIAVDYYSSNVTFHPLSFNPDLNASPLILFKNISIDKLTKTLKLNVNNLPKANDEWFRIKKLENTVVGKKHRK